jgi:hypothetical protein
VPLPVPTATEEQVLEILEEDHVPDGVSLDPFLTAAVMAMYGRGAYTTYDYSQIEVLETWLAAHFTCIAYPLLSEEVIGRSREEVERKIGLGLDQTPYGQVFKTLDTSGLFRKRLIVTWLGTTPTGVGEAP